MMVKTNLESELSFAVAAVRFSIRRRRAFYHRLSIARVSLEWYRTRLEEA